MDAGAEDANRKIFPDVTIVELFVDDQPLVVPAARSTRKIPSSKQVTVRSSRLVKWGWISTLLIAPGRGTLRSRNG
ncbi:MAG TPA: hypothetical protein VKA57_04255 [Solirubrobacteraceae bacterium]|nr:hypothetical protein [Solirubrobacteraceae bacterium]